MAETEKPKQALCSAPTRHGKRKEDIVVVSNGGEKGKSTPKPRLFSFIGLDGKRYSLTPKQKVFSDEYVRTMGNGTQSAIVAYHQLNEVAAVTASENLRKPNIIEYLMIQFNKCSVGDAEAEAQLGFLIKQFGELAMKAKGLDMYFKIRGRYAPEKLEHSVNEELEKAIDRIAKALP